MTNYSSFKRSGETAKVIGCAHKRLIITHKRLKRALIPSISHFRDVRFKRSLLTFLTCDSEPISPFYQTI